MSQTAPAKKRPTFLIAIGGLIAICIVCICVSGTMNQLGLIPTPTPSSIPSSTLPPPPTDLPTETSTPLDPQSQLRIDIEKALGIGNRDVARLIQLNYDDPETGAIYVNWSINDNFTEDLIVFGAKSDATDILKAIARSGIQYTYVILSGSFPMSDAFGNSEERNVINLTFYKATVDKINWDGFLSDNIYVIADEANVWAQFQK